MHPNKSQPVMASELDSIDALLGNPMLSTKGRAEIVHTQTQTVIVNAAFLQEIKDDDVYLKTLMARLLEICTERTAVDVAPNLLSQFLEEVRDQIAMHFTLEEAYGYMDCTTDVSPRFSERATTLRSQHSDLYDEISKIAESTAEIVADGGSWQKKVSKTKAILARLRTFHERMSDHEAAEEQMLLESYNVDIGGEG